MRATANVYTSSLYADRVAAGVEWISSSLAERIFRFSFTPKEGGVREFAACREFVTPTGKEFDNIDTVLKHLIHAVNTPSLHFIRKSAKRSRCLPSSSRRLNHVISLPPLCTPESAATAKTVFKTKMIALTTQTRRFTHSLFLDGDIISLKTLNSHCLPLPASHNGGHAAVTLLP
jgi:hypothetical protein